MEIRYAAWLIVRKSFWTLPSCRLQVLRTNCPAPSPGRAAQDRFGQNVGLGILGVVKSGWPWAGAAARSNGGARPTWLIPALSQEPIDGPSASAAGRPAAAPPAPTPARPARASRTWTRSPRPGGSSSAGHTSCNGPFSRPTGGNLESRAATLAEEHDGHRHPPADSADTRAMVRL